MASYATISDVNALVPQSPFTAATSPSQAQVEAFSVQVSRRVEASLRNLGYTVPIAAADSPESYALVKEAVSWGTLGLAQQVRQTAVTSNDVNDISMWTKMFLSWLDRLGSQKDPFELPDAVRDGKAVIKPLGEIQSDTSSLSGFTYNDDLTGAGPGPVFQLGMKFVVAFAVITGLMC